MTQSFAALLLQHRGRTRLTQRELALRVGASRRSVQDWESGITRPDAQHLRALIAVLNEAGGFAVSQALPDAEALWAAARREAPRMRTLFDPTWFAGVIAARSEATESVDIADQSALDTADRRADWSEAPDVLPFLGRTHELATLRGWVLEKGCRLVAILGMGGIGKTMLASQLAHDVAPAFARIHWRSLRNAPPADDWLSDAIVFLSDQHVIPPVGDGARLEVLLDLLRERRCLLVLDNAETLLASGERSAPYRDGYAGYGRILHTLGESSHRSCLVLTSREAPPELTMVGRNTVRALELPRARPGGGPGVARGQAPDGGRGGVDHAHRAMRGKPPGAQDPG